MNSQQISSQQTSLAEERDAAIAPLGISPNEVVLKLNVIPGFQRQASPGSTGTLPFKEVNSDGLLERDQAK